MSEPKAIQQPDFKVAEESGPLCEQLRSLIANSSRIVAFTGAGISAESGIPTYRGQGGLWTRYDPEKFASIDYFRRDPSYYWNFFKDVRYQIISQAKPNAGHYALAELEQRGQLRAVITQNIDGLHHQAGSKRVLELHGNTTRYYCTQCGSKYTIEEAWIKVQDQIPVICDHCAQPVRADVVMFGEMLPQKTLLEAEQESQNCDLLIVIGSSLVVYPAANLPYLAKQNRARLVIINVDPTPLDLYADLLIQHPSAKILAGAVW